MRHRPIDKPDGTFCQDCGAELRNVDDLRAECPSRLSDEPLDPATEEWVNVIRNRPMPGEPRQVSVDRDVLRIAGEHASELADILRAVRLEHRAELLDDFASALIDAADGQAVKWDELLADLHRREEAARTGDIQQTEEG